MRTGSRWIGPLRQRLGRATTLGLVVLLAVTTVAGAVERPRVKPSTRPVAEPVTGGSTVDVSGTVTDGSGAGWPLWARVTFTPTSAGTTVVAYTDPATGDYSVTGQVSADTEYEVLAEALIPGYNTETRMIMTPAVKAVTEDFELEIDGGACDAPGYEPTITSVLSEDFAGGIPGTWTVSDSSTACAAGIDTWSTTDLAPLSPTISTIVTPLFAVINSDACGSGANIITDLETPTFNLSGLGGAADALQIGFNSDYRDLCTAPGDAVSLDVWNGSAWVTVFDFCAQTTHRNTAESFATQAANGVANAKVRFHYDSGWDWWWAVDDVEIATSSCSYQGGGIDLGLRDGCQHRRPGGRRDRRSRRQHHHHGCLARSGDRRRDLLRAGRTGCAARDRLVPRLRRRHRQRQRGRGWADPPRPRAARRPAGAQPRPDQRPGAALHQLQRQRQRRQHRRRQRQLVAVRGQRPGAQAFTPTGPIQNVPPRVSGDKELIYAPTARNLPGEARRTDLPALPSFGGGDVDGTFDTGLPGGPYGNAVKDSPSLNPLHTVEVWLGNVAAIAGDDEIHQFFSNGVDTFTAGTVVPEPVGPVFWADATYNQRTESFWQVDVGGDNCIHEFTAGGFTANPPICPAFATSQRGLAYDPITDTYYSGSFNDGVIVQFATDGTILRQVFLDLDTVGLAFNPVTGHLFVMQNTNSPEADVVVLDTADPSFLFLNAFDIVKNNVSVMADFEQGGLDIDCQGRLWANNFTTGQVFVATSGEKNACTDIPWLTITPTSGTTAAGGSTPVTLTFDANLSRPGYHQSYLILDNDTPYGSQNVPVNFTAAFLDVSPGGFDRFIHGLAGAGITAGCGAGNFCPNGLVTRGLMPLWLLLAKYGFHYKPPHATGVLFADVPAEYLGVDFIEQFYHLGITAGCGTNPLRYCPDTPVTRAQMAFFLLRTLEGPNYTPPPATGIFSDVPIANPLAPWIEEMFNRGITAGCGTMPLRFCPNGNVSRGSMAVFVTQTFDIPVSP